MTIISELVVKMGIDSAQLNRGLADANTAVEKTGTKVSGIAGGISAGIGSIIKYGAMAAAAGAAAAGIAGASMLASASNIQNYRTTLMTLYGDEKTVADKLKWIFDFAKSTPFEVPQLVSAFVRLKSYGIEGEAALQTLGDAASALGKPLESAVEAVADAMTGEFERLKEFGVKAVVINKQNYEQMGLDIKTVGQTALSYVDKNGKQQFAVIDRNNKDVIQSTLFSIWNEKYKGGMDAQSRTFSGMVSNIKDSMTQAGLSIMGFDKEMGNFRPGSLFIKIQDVTKKIMDYMGTVDWTAIGLKITAWVTTAINIISKLWTDIQPILNLVIAKIKELYGWFTDHPEVAKTIGLIAVGFMAWSTLSPIITGVATAIKVFGASISSSSALVAALGGPITVVILAIGALYLAWSTNFGGLKDKTSEVWTMISPIFNEIKDWLISKIPVALEFLRSTMVTVMGILTKVWAGIGPIIKDAMTIISVVVIATLYGMYLKTKETINNVIAFWNYFKDIIIPILNLISASIKFAWDIAVAVIGGAMRIIKDIVTGNWGDIWTTIEATCSKIWEAVKKYFGSIVTSVGQLLQAVWDKIVEIWTGIWNYLFGGSIIPDIYNAFVKWFGDIATAISDVWTAINNGVSSAWATITSTLYDVWTGIKNIASSIWGSIQSIFTSISIDTGNVRSAWDSVKDTLQSVWNGLKSAAQSAWDAIQKIWDKAHTGGGGGGGGDELGESTWIPVQGNSRVMYKDLIHPGMWLTGAGQSEHYNPEMREFEPHSLAQGGSFWTQGPTPLLVGEGGESEFVSVTPLSKMDGSGTGNTYNFIVQGNVYGVDDLKRHFENFMRDMNRNVKSMGG